MGRAWGAGSGRERCKDTPSAHAITLALQQKLDRQHVRIHQRWFLSDGEGVTGP